MASHTVSQLTLRSADPKSFRDILGRSELAALPPRPVTAELHLPPAGLRSGGALLPAVVQLHGSFGWLQHHRKHRDALVAAGFAVLPVDSFASRGVASTAEKQGTVTMAALMHDAYRGLDALRAHPLIDAARIGVAGWSLGGGAAVYAALDVVDRALNPSRLSRFAAHLAVYPGCGLRTADGHTWTPGPIVMLCGTADDYTPVQLCDQTAARINAQGGRAEVLRYEGGHHSFDNPEYNGGKRLYNPGFQAMGSDLVVDLLPDGTQHFTGHPDKPCNTIEEFTRSIEALGGKMKLGATVGGDPRLAPLAFRDVLRFFNDTLGGAPGRSAPSKL